MPSTLATYEQLEEFQTFAHQRLSTGQAESMRQIFQAWLALREQSEVVADMRASDADIAAGRVTPLDEAIAEVREKLGIRQ